MPLNHPKETGSYDLKDMANQDDPQKEAAGPQGQPESRSKTHCQERRSSGDFVQAGLNELVRRFPQKRRDAENSDGISSASLRDFFASSGALFGGGLSGFDSSGRRAA
jgi:hypothetical protein